MPDIAEQGFSEVKDTATVQNTQVGMDIAEQGFVEAVDASKVLPVLATVSISVSYQPDPLTAALVLTVGLLTLPPLSAAVSGPNPDGTYTLSADLTALPPGMVAGGASVQPGDLVLGVFSPNGPPVLDALMAPPAVLTTADMDAVRGLAGVLADEWPDALVSSLPYLGAALAESARRFPCDLSLLDPASQQFLRLALIYQTASLVVPAANPAKTEDFKVGSFTFKTNDAMLLGDAGTLMAWANQYYSQIVLPPGVLPLAIADAFVRPMVRKANTAQRRPFGGGCY